MVQEQRASVTKASLTDGEMLSLLTGAGIRPGRVTPLARLNGAPAAPDAQKLQQSGLADGSGRPTTTLIEALNILAAPAVEISLLWGSPDGVSWSNAYAAAGRDKLVSFTALNGSNNLSFFLSPQDITDLLAQRLAFSDIKNIAPLDFEAAPAAVPALFAVLDICREEQLKAALERRQELAVTISAEAVNRVLQEAKMETNFSWYSPVAFSALPLDAPVTEDAAAQGLKALVQAGLVGSSGDLSSTLTTFAARAFPVAGFFGVKVVNVAGAAPEKTQLALFRGISTLLLAQLTPQNTVAVSSIATSQLPELLFNLSTRPFEAPPTPAPAPAPPPAPSAAATVFCTKCGTKNITTAKFCTKCGAALAPSTATPAAGPKFCPKCGDPVTANEKFCDKCGAPIK